jgi:fatty-acyl-CoA synthase
VPIVCEQTLPDLLRTAAADTPEAEAVVDGKTRLSYADLNQRVSQLAGALDALGVRRGTRVALWMVNRAEWIVTYFAVAQLGAVLVAINTRYTSRECRHILEQSGAEMLVMQDAFRASSYTTQLREMCPEIDAGEPGRWRSETLPALREVVVVGEDVPQGARRFDLVAAEAVEPVELPHIEPDDPALLLFTSGTTSRPKGVPLTHRNVIANSYYSGERQQLTPRDRMLFVLPLCSAFSCVHGIVAIFSHGGTAVLLEAFSAEDCLALIEQERCTSMYGVDSVFQALIAHPRRDSFDLSSLRTGVGVLSPEVASAIYTELGVPDYHGGYGSTEVGGVATVTSVVDPLEIRLQSAGTPVPGCEVSIVDPETGSVSVPGAEGEIRLRGFNVMAGYDQDEKASGAVLDQDGWYHTGDLGRILPGGYLQFRGRLKDVLKPNGFNVSPVEVEEVLALHPAVRLCAVVGVPDRHTTEAGYAYLVIADGMATPTYSELREHCAKYIAKFKIPAHFEFVYGDLPRNDLGKILRGDLARAAGSAVGAAE